MKRASPLPPLTLLLLALLLSSCKPPRIAPAPPSLPAAIYPETIQPWLRQNCLPCHDHDRTQAPPLFTSRGTLRPDLIEPGHPESSPLYLRLLTDSQLPQSPPAHRADPAQLGLLQHWILAGAPDFRDWANQPWPTPASPSYSPFTRPEAALTWYQKAHLLALGEPPNAATLQRAREIYWASGPETASVLLSQLLEDPRFAQRQLETWLALFPDAPPAFATWSQEKFQATPSLFSLLNDLLTGDLQQPSQAPATSALASLAPPQRLRLLRRHFLADPHADLYPFQQPLPPIQQPQPTPQQHTALQEMDLQLEVSREDLELLPRRRHPHYLNWSLDPTSPRPLPGLTACWPLDADTGPWPSHSLTPAPPLTATPDSPPTSLPGLHATALQLTPPTTLSSPSPLHPEQDLSWTLSAWIQLPTPEAHLTLARLHPPDSSHPAPYQLHYHQGTWLFQTPELTLHFQSLPLQKKRWHHLTLRRDPLASDGATLSLFLDAQALPLTTLASATSLEAAPAPPPTPEWQLTWGSPHPGDSPLGLDEINLFQRALSLAEITDLAGQGPLSSRSGQDPLLTEYYFQALDAPSYELRRAIQDLLLSRRQLRATFPLTPVWDASVNARQRRQTARQLLTERRRQIARTWVAHLLTRLQLPHAPPTPDDLTLSGIYPSERRQLDDLARILDESDGSFTILWQALLSPGRLAPDPTPVP